MIEAELSRQVFDAFYAVYRELGYGYLETVYENSLMVALSDLGLRPVQQSPLHVWFRGHLVGDFRADIVIPGRMLIEIKSATRLVAAHDAQLLNYLKTTGLRLGLILNFSPKPETRRRAN